MKDFMLLTDCDKLALWKACRYWGRNWKRELRDCWMFADYPSSLDSATLQRLRNASYFGPKGLQQLPLDVIRPVAYRTA